jgi:hypothetical protein
MTYSELVVRVSAHFLTKPLPDNWMDLEPDDLDQFMQDHAWEPLENKDTDDVLFIIESLAQDMGKIFDVEAG